MAGRAGRAALAAALGATFVLSVASVVAGRRRDGYDHGAQYLSELGERDAPDGGAVSVAFLVVGVLVATFVGTALAAVRSRGVTTRLMPLGIACFATVAASYGVASAARCDPGCPDRGKVSAAQQIHNAAGALGYLGGGTGLILLAIAARRDGSQLAGFRNRAAVGATVYLVVLVASLNAPSDHRGWYQRSLEAGLFAAMIAVGADLAGRETGPGPSE